MQELPAREWRRGDFLPSKDPSLDDIDAINAAFASDAMPWAVKIPEDLRTAINSCPKHAVTVGHGKKVSRNSDPSKFHTADTG